MKYLKNVEIAEMYKVSPNTVGNWIDAAGKYKNGLELFSDGKRSYILNTSTNHLILKNLSSKGKKFKNSKSLKIVTPSPEFYKIFNERQIIQIINSLELYKEVDLKFGYFDAGADSFDDYVKNSMKDINPTTPNNTNQLLDFNSNYIYSLIKDYKGANIVDIGPGNAQPVKNLLEFLISKKILRKYIALDYSADMLNIAENNVKKWFGDKVLFEKYVKDINYDVFQDILFKNISTEKNPENVNLILYVGSTIENQRSYTQSLHIIKDSMGPSDLFILNHRLDTSGAKMTLSFNKDDTKKKDIEVIFLVMDLLNIDESLYDTERLYNSKDKSRIIRVRLKRDIKIEFKTGNLKKTVSLSNRDRITLWRHRHHKYVEVINVLTDVGFDVLHSSTSLDHDQIMVISKVSTNN